MKILAFEDNSSKVMTLESIFEVAQCTATIIEQLPKSPSCREFIQILDSLDEFDLILVDGSMPNGVDTADGFIQAMRKKYSGLMIGISGNGTHRLRQIAAGCDDAVDLLTEIKKLLAVMADINGDCQTTSTELIPA